MVLISPFYRVANFFWIWCSTNHNILKYKQIARTLMSSPAANKKNPATDNIQHKQIEENKLLLKNNLQNTTNFKISVLHSW